MVTYNAYTLGAAAKPKGRPEPQPQRDAPPDKGCDLWPECLSCPLPQCRHDMTYPELLEALDALTRPTG